MDKLEKAVMTFVQNQGFLPGENLCDLVDNLREHKLADWGDNENLDKTLTNLVRKGKLRLHVRKDQFLQFLPC